jgi:hypothetical protein
MDSYDFQPHILRDFEATQRRQQREAQKRQREIERQAKEREKLSQQEQARLEVERYENRLEVILSIHKEQGESWNWSAIATILPPYPPQSLSIHESRMCQCAAVSFHPKDKESWEIEIGKARVKDEKEQEERYLSYCDLREEWETLNSLAKRILSGDHSAHSEALATLQPLSEISVLGSSFLFIPHSQALLECRLKVNGVEAIPDEIKSLTSTGKLSSKPMPKARFHEIYQDYVCGCMLRVFREVFAFLPVSSLLITASADLFDGSTGQIRERPVVSAVIRRNAIATLNFDQLDPSDAIESFQHRGDFKATRKSGAFLPIEPIKASEIEQESADISGIEELIEKVHRFRLELEEECGELGATEIQGHE